MTGPRAYLDEVIGTYRDTLGGREPTHVTVPVEYLRGLVAVVDPDPATIDRHLQSTDESGVPFSALPASGLLWLVNRTCLHPRGYALALCYPDGTTRADVDAGTVEPTGWTIYGDGTEPWQYATEMEEDSRFAAVERLLAAARANNAPT